MLGVMVAIAMLGVEGGMGSPRALGVNPVAGAPYCGREVCTGARASESIFCSESVIGVSVTGSFVAIFCSVSV